MKKTTLFSLSLAIASSLASSLQAEVFRNVTPFDLYIENPVASDSVSSESILVPASPDSDSRNPYGANTGTAGIGSTRFPHIQLKDPATGSIVLTATLKMSDRELPSYEFGGGSVLIEYDRKNNGFTASYGHHLLSIVRLKDWYDFPDKDPKQFHEDVKYGKFRDF